MGGAQKDNNDESNEVLQWENLTPHTELRNIETFLLY